MNTKPKTIHTILENGLNVVLHHIPFTKKCCAAVFVNVGTDDEDKKVNGISHFLEHMAFKGTKNRSVADIFGEIESLGADMNAFTARAMTAYHINGHYSDWPQYVDVLSDIILNSTFPEDEIEKERDVILQEYLSNVADNQTHAHETSRSCLFPNQPQGRPVLGSMKSISNISRQDLLCHVEKYYTANNMVVGIAGNIENSKKMLKLIEAKFKGLRRATTSEGKNSQVVPTYTLGTKKHVKRSNPQASVAVCFKAAPAENTHLNLVASLALGAGFSSPLVTEIRERQGLAYSIGAYCDKNKGYEVISIEADLFSQNIQKLISSTKVIMQDCSKNLAMADLHRALNMLRSEIEFMSEEKMNYLESQARNIFEKNELIDFDKDLSDLNAITLEDVQNVIHDWVTQDPVIAIVGPKLKEGPTW